MFLIVAGRTAPNRAVCFGGEHRPLDARGIADVAALRTAVPSEEAGVRAGPEASVRQTAGVLGPSFDVDPALATLDVGAWRGLRPDEIRGPDLGLWFADPDATPHGGESIRAFVSRIRRHVDAIGADGRVSGDVGLVVAKPVAQALLCDGPDRFFRADVRPGSMVGPENWRN